MTDPTAPETVSRSEWERARHELLEREKKHTRAGRRTNQDHGGTATVVPWPSGRVPKRPPNRQQGCAGPLSCRFHVALFDELITAASVSGTSS